MSADPLDTEDLRMLVAIQASTIATLQAELVVLRAAVPAHVPQERAASSSTGSAAIVVKEVRRKPPSDKQYLGVMSYLPWNETRILKLLKAVSEVELAAAPDNEGEGLEAVKKAYLRLSELDEPSKFTVLEIEYALGKIYHDKHRYQSLSICTTAVYDYLRDHPEISQFFSKHLGGVPSNLRPN